MRSLLGSLMQLFNGFVNDTGLRELHRHGSTFTWTNKQIHPIMVVLGRVFISPGWEREHPLTTAQSLTRVGSDHNPLLVESVKRWSDLNYSELNLSG